MFELGSLICGAAPSSSALIVGRAIAGIGVGGIFSGALIISAYAGSHFFFALGSPKSFSYVLPSSSSLTTPTFCVRIPSQYVGPRLRCRSASRWPPHRSCHMAMVFLHQVNLLFYLA
jgi:MFS family permease